MHIPGGVLAAAEGFAAVSVLLAVLKGLGEMVSKYTHIIKTHYINDLEVLLHCSL